MLIGFRDGLDGPAHTRAVHDEIVLTRNLAQQQAALDPRPGNFHERGHVIGHGLLTHAAGSLLLQACSFLANHGIGDLENGVHRQQSVDQLQLDIRGRGLVQLTLQVAADLLDFAL